MPHRLGPVVGEVPAGEIEALTLALWSSLWIGEMFRHGVESAMQWDALSGGEGHDAGSGWVMNAAPAWRRCQYWAFWLWANHMGDTLLSATLTGGASLSVVATRGPEAVHVMLVNRDRDRPVRTRVRLTGFAAGARGRAVTLSPREYLWDGAARHPRWSRAPEPAPLATGRDFVVTVPPYSVVVASVPARHLPPTPLPRRPPTAGTPRLAVLLPAEAYAEGEITGWVIATGADGTTPWPDPLPDAAVTATGPARLARTTARLAEAAGRIGFSATGPGLASITATLGRATASATLYLKPAVPRPMVLWEFESPALDPAKYRSEWTLSTDATIRPNQAVARIEFAGRPPEGDKRRIVVRIDDFPARDRLDRSGIRGVFFDAALAPSFACADPAAALEVVMQSPDNWWINLGSVPVSGLSAGWSTWTLPVTDARHLAAVGNAFTVWIILRATGPVHGAMFIDRAGLMVR